MRNDDAIFDYLERKWLEPEDPVDEEDLIWDEDAGEWVYPEPEEEEDYRDPEEMEREAYEARLDYFLDNHDPFGGP